MQGVRASHPVDGDITKYVDACRAGVRYNEHGLQACTYDTSVPGVYPITFTVTVPGTSLHASVTRRLVVYPLCAELEFSCLDLRCSIAEMCLSAAGALQLPGNEAPRLTLQDGHLAKISVQAGSSYERCGEGAELACEGGVLALDPEEGDLSRRVLACPPDSCLPFGCPGHEFEAKGVCPLCGAHAAALQHGPMLLGAAGSCAAVAQGHACFAMQ